MLLNATIVFFNTISPPAPVARLRRNCFLPLLSQHYILCLVPRYQLLSIHSSHTLTYPYIINKHHGSKHRRVPRHLRYSNADMRQYNGYGQSNPYGSNSGYDTPPTYSTCHYLRNSHPVQPSVRRIAAKQTAAYLAFGEISRAKNSANDPFRTSE